MSLSGETHEHEKSSDDSQIRNSKPLVDSAEEDDERIPDIGAMFTRFNSRFFDGRLNGVEVRWSSRLTSSGATCTFEGGSCSIKLNEHLLACRTRKDLVETLLHEMIHAYFFVVDANQNRQEHNSAFFRQMARINEVAGTNVRPHHNLYEEVDPFRRRWWRCSGPCQKWAPRFGIVTRCRGYPPGPGDVWWTRHELLCGGAFTKVHGPDGYSRGTHSCSSSEDENTSVDLLNDNTQKVLNNTSSGITILPSRELVKCLFCDTDITISEIDIHYDVCLVTDNSGSTRESESEMINCPMCDVQITKGVLQNHLELCVPCILKSANCFVEDSDSELDEDSESVSSDELVMCTLCMNFVKEDVMSSHHEECQSFGGEVDSTIVADHIPVCQNEAAVGTIVKLQ